MYRYRLFDIQRNSFVDGPGIRTTVFFRGCNLHCKWCHNPESQSGNKYIFHYKNLCTQCGKCTSVCAKGAIRNGKVDYSKCVFCKKCELYCQNNALKQCGEEYSLDELFDIIKKDKNFYDNSGGGVTFSGGECMLYPNELVEILKLCKENDIHTCIDTAGNVSYENFEKVLPYTDLLLYDIKLIDRKKHKEYTGVSNELILNNLKRLFEDKAKIWIRIPVISGVNDNTEEMERIKNFLVGYKPCKIELLPYHKMGESKYEALNMDIVYFDVPSVRKMDKFKAIFDIGERK